MRQRSSKSSRSISTIASAISSPAARRSTHARRLALADLDAPGALSRRLAAIERPPPPLPPPGAPSRGRWLRASSRTLATPWRRFADPRASRSTSSPRSRSTIGPTTAMLSIGNWLIWRPPPGVVQPDRLAVVWVGQWRTRGASVSFSPSGGLSYLNLDDLRQASKTLTGIAGVQEGSVSLAAGDLAPSVAGAGWVDGGFLRGAGRSRCGRPLVSS